MNTVFGTVPTVHIVLDPVHIVVDPVFIVVDPVFIVGPLLIVVDPVQVLALGKLKKDNESMSFRFDFLRLKPDVEGRGKSPETEVNGNLSSRQPTLRMTDKVSPLISISYSFQFVGTVPT